MKPLIFPYKTPLGYYFYETQRNEIVSVNKELYEYIKEIIENNGNDYKVSERTKTEYDELISAGYLKPPYIENIKHMATPLLGLALERKVARILLQVTQNCNLKCKYCIYSESKNLNTRSHSNNAMTFQTAIKAVDFYAQHSLDNDEKTIGFYGGEPLLNFKLIKKVIEYANEIFKGKDVIYSITTNGTLLTDDVIDFFLKHNVQLTISLDGPREIHDKNRCFRDGCGSYDIVMKNLETLRKKSKRKMPFSVSMVVDPENDYDEIVKVFKNPILQGINANIAIVEENETTKRYSEDYYSKFEKDLFFGFLSEFREQKCNSGSMIVQQEIQQMNTSLNTFKTNILSNIAAPGGPCVPGKMRLFIDCFGNLFPCERVSETVADFRIGTLDTGFDINKISNLLNIAKLTENTCKNCWAFSLCTVCAKYAVGKNSLCKEKKLERCAASKEAAYLTLLEKTLIYENKEHERNMMSVKGKKYEKDMYSSIYQRNNPSNSKSTI